MNKMERPRGTPAPPRDDVGRIMADPRFRDLVGRRSTFAWTLTGIMVAIYLGFILLAAFDKPLMAVPVVGVTTLGIVLGLGVIVVAFVLTGVYVRRANRDFDHLATAVREGRR